MSDLFKHFKRTTPLGYSTNKKRVNTDIFFQLVFDDYGAYIDIVNKKGKSIEVSYFNYNGATKNVLRAIEVIKDRNSFVIDWEKSSDKVYLKDNEHLIWQLKNCDNFVDAELDPIQFSDIEAKIELQVAEKDDKNYASKIVLTGDGKIFNPFQLLSDNYVLAVRESIIVEIPSSSTTTGDIHYFNATFPKEDIQRYLSLFFSHVDNIDVRLSDYTIQTSQDTIIAEPSLVFEKIDDNDSLYLRVKQVIPSLGVDFLEQYDLYRVAELNELDKVINVKLLDQQPIEMHLNEIQMLLDKSIPRKGRKKLGDDIIREDDLFIVPKEAAGNFIHRELPNLLLRYKVFGVDKLKSYKISTRQPTLNLKLEHGIDFLSGDAELVFGEDEVMSLFEVISQYDKQNFIRLSDGTHAIVNEKYIDKLKRIFKKQKDKKVKVSFFDLPMVEELIDEKVAESMFAKSRAVFEGFNTLQSKRTRIPKIKATLRPYQKQGFKWLNYLHEENLGGCLADDMGLGKTLQTITMFSKIYPQEKMPSLVIMPRSLIYNWQKEIKKFNPSLTAYIYYGTNRNLKEALKHNLIITTYAIARNDIKQFKEEEFYYVVLDESQNIKNTNAQTTKAVMLLNSKHRLALSGTPIENNLGELYSLFRFLNPAMFGSADNFNRNYGIPIQREGNMEVVHELRRKIYPFIMRRLKKDVLKELPDKIEQTLYVDMSPEQKQFYEERRLFYQTAVKAQIATQGIKKSQFFIFQALNELRQLASIPEAKTNGAIQSPKRLMLVEHLLDAIANEHKVLVFVNFLATIELVAEQLEASGIDFVTMTGATRNRQALVDKFQTDKNCKVFLMTLKTGGTGLNLTEADMVFIFDPWWNVAAENQAIDRTHRIGQKNTVTSYKMITQGSIEEKILQLQEKKKELFDSVISSDTSAFKSLSEDDIKYILS